MREVVFHVLAERPGHLEAKADTLPIRITALLPFAAELGCPVKGHGHHRLDHRLACAGRR